MPRAALPALLLPLLGLAAVAAAGKLPRGAGAARDPSPAGGHPERTAESAEGEAGVPGRLCEAAVRGPGSGGSGEAPGGSRPSALAGSQDATRESTVQPEDRGT